MFDLETGSLGTPESTSSYDRCSVKSNVGTGAKLASWVNYVDTESEKPVGNENWQSESSESEPPVIDESSLFYNFLFVLCFFCVCVCVCVCV